MKSLMMLCNRADGQFKVGNAFARVFLPVLIDSIHQASLSLKAGQLIQFALPEEMIKTVILITGVLTNDRSQYEMIGVLIPILVEFILSSPSVAPNKSQGALHLVSCQALLALATNYPAFFKELVQNLDETQRAVLESGLKQVLSQSSSVSEAKIARVETQSAPKIQLKTFGSI